MIDALPPAPAATDPVNTFDDKAFAFNAALQNFRTQANSLADDVQINADILAAVLLGMALPEYAGTSASSFAVGTGSKVFATQSGRSWQVGQIVVVSNGANVMRGTVTDYTGSNLTVDVTSAVGGGTFSSWTIGLSFQGELVARAGNNSDIRTLTGLVGPGLLPVGFIGTCTGNAAPTGFIKANGALLSRTAYANLWAFAQASGNLAASDGAWANGQYSPGDGSTTFRIPDLRGEFLRYWDNGRGVDSGRAFGSAQLDQMQRITGAVDAGFGNSGARLIGGSSSGAFTLTKGSAGGNLVTVVGFSSSDYTMNEVFDSGGSPGARVSSSTSGETRPRNVAYLPCINF